MSASETTTGDAPSRVPLILAYAALSALCVLAGLGLVFTLHHLGAC